MCFDIVKPNSVGKGSIDIKGLRSYLYLLVLWHGIHGEHIVVTVRYFNDDYPNIIMQGQ